MPTLFETIDARSMARSVGHVELVKATAKLNISASISKKSPDFHHVRVKLSKIPLLFASGAKDDGPIVLDKNFNRLGRLHCSYVPSVVVLGGRNTLKAMKAGRDTHVLAWVGKAALKPLKIMASDALSNSVIEDKLRQLVRDTYAPKIKNSPTYYEDCPYLVDVFQDDNYCVFRSGKAMYRQNYKINPTTRNITLDGQKVEVFQTYTSAPTGDISSSYGLLDDGPSPIRVGSQSTITNTSMSYTGPDPNSPVHGGRNGQFMNEFNVDITTFGAPTSELNNPQYKTMSNVEEALDQYLAMLKNGMHKPVSMIGLVTPPAYVNAARETVLALNACGESTTDFSVMDFIKWQNKRMSMPTNKQGKLVNGELLASEDFAYVGDLKDISTWHLPISSRENVAHSIMAMATATAIPKHDRADVREQLDTLALGYGLKIKGRK
jgi:hypothetical protein